MAVAGERPSGFAKMTTSTPQHIRWLSSLRALPTAAALLALVLATSGDALSPHGALGRPEVFALALVLAAAAALHRPIGGSFPGMGAVVLAPAFSALGVVPAGWLAAGAIVAAELVRRFLARAGTLGLPERRRILRVVEASAAASLATLAAGSAWVWTGSALLATVTYLSVLGVLRLVEIVLYSWLPRPGIDVRSRRRLLALGARSLVPLLVDAFGWGVGWLLMGVGESLGWSTAGLLVGVVAALSLEAFHQAHQRGLAADHLEDLQQVSRAGQRVTTEGKELVSVVGHIHREVVSVLPVSWLSLELADEEEEQGWWSVGPDAAVHEGPPAPGTHPPVRLGIHRRAEWKVLQPTLEVEGKTLARLRLWCDPRRLARENETLLAELIPQLATTLHRALLDRQARRDPLTGLAVRRIFERQLRRGFERCRAEGGRIAVILCDLDHFKKVNDTYGHAAGDAVLTTVARALKEELGRYEPATPGLEEAPLISRYGGEEIVVLLPGADGTEALALAEALRRSVEELQVEVEGGALKPTLSAGVAAFPDLFIRLGHELLPLADGALYEAKRQGRNRCFLDRGRGRYEDPTGEIFSSESTPREPDPPRIFA